MTSKHLAKLFGALMAVVAAVAMVAPVAQAETPAAGYEQFAGCPSPKTENPLITSCIHSVVTGGHFQMGSKDVPITNPIPLTGGSEPNFANFSFNSEGGLGAVKQPVPGGVVGLTGLDWLVDLLNAEQLKLYAVTELAGTPQLGLTSLTLPIKVHLINPVLGNKCYVGSNASPIVLNMTTETTSPPPPNEPISGKEPELELEPVRKINKANNAEFVDNAFAAPGVNGCVLNIGFIPVNIDAIVNVASGLPSPAGTNETRQEIDIEFVQSKRVYP
jgi:hypothetical protein